MRKIFLLLLFTIHYSLFTSFAQRSEQKINFGWEFRLNDEGSWKKVNVPHDFQIEQPWVAPAADEKADNTDVAANIKSRLSSRGFKEMGKGITACTIHLRKVWEASGYSSTSRASCTQLTSM